MITSLTFTMEEDITIPVSQPPLTVINITSLNALSTLPLTPAEDQLVQIKDSILATALNQAIFEEEKEEFKPIFKEKIAYLRLHDPEAYENIAWYALYKHSTDSKSKHTIKNYDTPRVMYSRKKAKVLIGDTLNEEFRRKEFQKYVVLGIGLFSTLITGVAAPLITHYVELNSNNSTSV